MKAAVFSSVEQMSVTNIEIGTPSDEQVLLEVKACGICGTDKYLYKGDMTFPVEGVSIFGHEFTGVVAETGKNVKDYKPGDRVAVNPNYFCGHCYFCKSGRENFCRNKTVLGGDMWGGFAEYCIADRRQLYLLPPHVSFEAGALAEPMSCCINAVNLLNIRTGASVVIIGAGGIGLLMLQLLRLGGAGTIIVSELSEKKRQVALSMGASFCVDPSKDNVNDVIRAAGLENVDAVVECAGFTETVNSAIDYAGKGASVMVFSTPRPGAAASLPLQKLFDHELHIMASYINPYSFSQAMKLLQADKLKLDYYTENVIKLDNLMDYFTTNRYIDAPKVIVTP